MSSEIFDVLYINQFVLKSTVDLNIFNCEGTIWYAFIKKFMKVM